MTDSGGDFAPMFGGRRAKQRFSDDRVAWTPGLFAAGALKRIGDHPGVLEIVCTNTVPIPVSDRMPKLEVLSIASAIAGAMRRIHSGESGWALFDNPDLVPGAAAGS